MTTPLATILSRLREGATERETKLIEALTLSIRQRDIAADHLSRQIPGVTEEMMKFATLANIEPANAAIAAKREGKP